MLNYYLLGAAAEKAKLASMKIGKTKEQKDVIDYFIKDGGCLGLAGLNLDKYTALVTGKCNEIDFRQRAISKINLDESQINEIPPIMMSSYVYTKDDDVFLKVDKGHVVTSRYAITWIFFSSEQIYTYKYVFNTTSDSVEEKTEDIFYRDITDMATTSDKVERIDVTSGCLSPKGNKAVYSYSGFAIRGAGFDLYYEMTSSPALEQSIQAAKACWREKKFIAQQR